jgi:NAD(P)-dependent dehydrogenase (short-subunit alcohol dehydrogenase family)
MSNYVIAGGSSGVGKSLVSSLLNKGHRVWVLARSRKDLPVEKDLNFIEYDFSLSAEEIKGLPDSIHGLAYCPGSIVLSPFNRIKPQQFINDFQINLIGAVNLIQAALPALKNAGNSSVVFFSTVAVKTGMPFHASIASAKGAVEGLTRSLAAEYASSSIRFNAIAPSLTNTPLAERLLNTPEKQQSSAARHPMGRFGEADDVAAAAEFLLGPESSWITGQILGVDGGMGSLKTL